MCRSLYSLPILRTLRPCFGAHTWPSLLGLLFILVLPSSIGGAHILSGVLVFHRSLLALVLARPAEFGSRSIIHNTLGRGAGLCALRRSPTIVFAGTCRSVRISQAASLGGPVAALASKLTLWRFSTSARSVRTRLIQPRSGSSFLRTRKKFCIEDPRGPLLVLHHLPAQTQKELVVRLEQRYLICDYFGLHRSPLDNLCLQPREIAKLSQSTPGDFLEPLKELSTGSLVLCASKTTTDSESVDTTTGLPQ